jgi:low affinity Fe/Cu permease
MSTKTPKEGVFQRIADKVSYLMGTPTNILIWLVLVLAWTSLFAFHIVGANSNFLPAWFTGTAFNFPLNMTTTVAELFIGFLVGAASNRSERNLEATLQRIEDVELNLQEAITQNTELTEQIKQDTVLLNEIHDHVSAITPQAGHFEPAEHDESTCRCGR